MSLLIFSSMRIVLNLLTPVESGGDQLAISRIWIWTTWTLIPLHLNRIYTYLLIWYHLFAFNWDHKGFQRLNQGKDTLSISWFLKSFNKQSDCTWAMKTCQIEKKRIKNSVLARLSDLMWGFRFDLTCLQDPCEKWMSNQKKNEFENLPIMLHDFMSWKLGESNSGSKLFVILNRYKAIMIVCQCKQAKLTSSWVLVSISQGNA